MHRAAAVLAAALLLAACTHGRTPAATSTGAGTGSVADAGRLQAATDALTAGRDATFKVVYAAASASSSGGPGTVTVERKPPKSLLSTPDGAVISDGTSTWFCSARPGAGTHPTCLAVRGANPLASLATVFSTQTVAGFLQGARAKVGASAAGYDVAVSHETFAGQASTCAEVTGPDPSASGKYCVTTGGILAFVGSPGGQTFEMTAYSASVPDSDFTLPAGANPQQLP